jgi:acetoin utilization protein AcuB
MKTHSKPIPSIQKYMSTNPHSVRVDETLATAQKLMNEYKIRHLPVLNGGKLCGILSDRDVKFAQSLKGLDIKTTKVGDISHDEVYVTHPDAALDEVVRNMAQKRLGSAVVMSNDKLVGIFTAVDAMMSLDQLLETRLA